MNERINCSSKAIVLLLAIFFSFNSMLKAQSPVDFATRAAKKIMRETSFELDFAPLNFGQGLHVLDFRRKNRDIQSRVYFALNTMVVAKNKTAFLCISHDSPVQIYLNGKIIYQADGNNFLPPKEVAYDRYTFMDTIEVDLSEKENVILIKMLCRNDNGILFLRAIKDNGDQDENVKFLNQIDGTEKWACIDFAVEEENLKEIFPPEKSIQPYYQFQNRYHYWYFPRTKITAKLRKPKNGSYTKKLYADWYYANGATMNAIYELGEFTKIDKFKQFVRKYCYFAVENMDLFRDQFENEYIFHGSFHRMFRLTMLDDAGAPVLPYFRIYSQTKDRKIRQIIQTCANYIMNQQFRLPDGTFCRPEPEPGTVWADDLFMSVPFLLRMQKITGEEKYFDEVARQIVNFHKYLFNKKQKLFFHGYFDQQRKNSIALWGRANGWIAWALSEALMFLPVDYLQYEKILEIYQEFMSGLREVQDSNGMWHQILDHPESYEETSCSAMFVLAMARGVRKGWLDRTFLDSVNRGWDALTGKIDADGTIHGICRGTGIGENLEFYFNRKTFDHAPHGVGAFITAGIEMELLQQTEK